MPKMSFDDALASEESSQPYHSGGNNRRKRHQRERFRPSAQRVREEEFKCGHCKTFVGPPVSGGRHRNHCPLCLFSRHVDRQTPGDRLSDCRSLMAPVGTWFRRNGEQVIVHQCLGCGETRNCRVAADDYHAACLRLAPWTVEPVSEFVALSGDEISA